MPTNAQISDHLTEARAVAADFVDALLRAQAFFFAESKLQILANLTDEQIAGTGHAGLTAQEFRAVAETYAQIAPQLEAAIVPSLKIRNSERRAR
jgi:hypothetical protein